MTPRERFFKVFNGEIPDRVPVTLFIQDQGHFLTQIYPDLDPWDFPTLQMKVIELQKQLGVDVFVRMVFDISDPITAIFGGLDVSQQTENWEVCTEEIENGNTLIKKSTIRTPEGTLTQDFSINKLRDGTYMFACTKKPIETPEDFKIARKYEPPMHKSYKQKVKQRVQKIKNALGDDGILGIWVPGGPFNNISTLISHEELYSMFLTDYEYYEELMDFAISRITPYTRAIDEAGADVLCVGGNVPGGFLGRRCYEEFILPFEKQYIDICQQHGTPAVYHNCGEIMNLIETYKKLGVKIVEPFSPYPQGDGDLARAKEVINGEYVIIGGVDQVNVLQKGTVDEVREVTENTMKIGKPGGGFIIQSADFLEYDTPVENLEAFVKTALENASY